MPWGPIDAGAQLAWPLLTIYVQGAVLIGCCWILSILCRGASAAVRHGIWTLGLLGLLLLPATRPLMPTIAVPIPLLVVEAMPAAAGVLALEESLEAAVVEGAELAIPEVSGAEGGPAGLAAAPRRGYSRGGWRWAGAVVWFWLIGVVARLAWLAIAYVWLRALTRDARTNRGDRVVHRAERIRLEMGIRRAILVQWSPAVSMPLTSGALRPRILLPQPAREWPSDRLDAVLRHELAHVRRCDFLTGLLTELACAIYWPLPLAWMARRRVRLEQEKACDDRVLASGVGPIEYADHLLAVAREVYGARGSFGLAVAMAREVSLTSRVGAILSEGVDRRPLRSPAGAAIACVLLVAYPPIAGARAEPVGPNRTSETGSLETLATAEPPAAEAAAPVSAPAHMHLWMEAEESVVLGAARTEGDLDASAIAFVALEEAAQRRPAAGELTFTFEVAGAGDYHVWARLHPVGHGRRRLEAQVDGRESGVWTLARRRNKTGRGWAWYALSAQGDAAGGGSAPLRLEPGDHTLRISAAEGEVRVDRVLITTDADYRPAGSGSTEVDVEREWRLIEVENTLLGGRVRASDEADVSGGGYLTFRSGRGEEPDGFATLDFEVPRGGRYLVWGRVFAPDDDSNSLYVALDNGDERIWDVPAAARWRGARPWRWDPIGAREDERGGADPLVFELTAGSHELRFRARESGVRLDALIITNDLYHRPSGLSGDGAVDPPVPSGEGVEELEPRVIPITLAPGLEPLPG